MNIENRLYIACYEFEGVADMKRLAGYDKYATQDIQRLEKAIEDIKAYRTELYNYVQELQNKPYELVLSLKRQKSYSDSKVFYYIKIDKVYSEDMKVSELSETYKGTERSKALARFEELKKSHAGIKAVKDIEKGRWEK